VLIAGLIGGRRSCEGLIEITDLDVIALKTLCAWTWLIFGLNNGISPIGLGRLYRVAKSINLPLGEIDQASQNTVIDVWIPANECSQLFQHLIGKVSGLRADFVLNVRGDEHECFWRTLFSHTKLWTNQTRPQFLVD